MWRLRIVQIAVLGIGKLKLHEIAIVLPFMRACLLANTMPTVNTSAISIDGFHTLFLPLENQIKPENLNTEIIRRPFDY